MADAVIQIVPLGQGPWPTLDPFLFCVHHHDDYPVGNAALGPKASLAGRQIGSDFAAKDGWNMYHGSVVPGFPQHPHRGFETVTVVREGIIDHSDSLGAAARFGSGDVQWMTAGAGIVHSEMFPLLNDDRPNPLELFQIWVNLPKRDKMVEPYFTMLWDHTIPRHHTGSADGPGAEVTVVAGTFAGLTPPAPPPNSWASHAEADVAIWPITLHDGASLALPPAASAATNRVVYVFDGEALLIDGQKVASGNAAVVNSENVLRIQAVGSGSVSVLVLQGRPIGEPVAQYGPFVMNDRAGIEQAFKDYQKTQFGGWPWPSDDPTHPITDGRFARHPDGRREDPSVLVTG